MTAGRGPQMVPAEPIAKALIAFRDGQEMSNRRLALEFGAYSIERQLRYLFAGQEWISFAIADRILCRIGKPELWHTDPVLSEHYERAASWVPRRPMSERQNPRSSARLRSTC